MRTLRALKVPLATLALAACGGRVVVEDRGGAGGADASDAVAATGSGGAASTATAVGPTSTAVATAGAGGFPPSPAPATGDAYVDYCGFLHASGCGIGATIGQCVDALYQVKFYSGSCYPEFDRLLECYAESAGSLESCGDVGPCAEFVVAYDGCVDAGGGECHAQSCSEASDGSCSCSAFCFGGAVKSVCLPAEDGESRCDCILNGSSIGSCSVPQDDFVCGLLAGCCAPVFGTKSPP